MHYVLAKVTHESNKIMYVMPCEAHSRFAVCLINSDTEEHAVYTAS